MKSPIMKLGVYLNGTFSAEKKNNRSENSVAYSRGTEKFPLIVGAPG
jgi:hypothetical protein